MHLESQRNLEIVEELRADIDFEIDDVIAQIVRGLPDDYFRLVPRPDQLKHLKALLALNMCDVKEEIRMRSQDGRFVAVVARQDYPGLLANILNQLPEEPALVGAKVFTSRDHDFIIDLFEFQSDQAADKPTAKTKFEIEEKVLEVANQTGQDKSEVRDFASQYNPDSPIFDSVPQLIAQFEAYRHCLSTGLAYVDFNCNDAKVNQLTIACGSSNVLEIFRTTAKFLGDKGCDIHQAILNDFTNQDRRCAVAGLQIAKITKQGNPLTAAMADELKACFQ